MGLLYREERKSATRKWEKISAMRVALIDYRDGVVCVLAHYHLSAVDDV